MKKKSFRKSKLLVLVLLLMITVGFATLSATVSFNGIFNIKATKWDVHFENVSVSTGSVKGNDVVLAPEISKDEKGNDTKVTYGVILDKPTDYYEFTVDVVNKGNVNAKVDSIDITELTDAQKEYLDYVVTYNDGTEIKKDDTLDVNETKTLKVKVTYKESVTEIPSDAGTEIELSYTVTYVQGDKSEVKDEEPELDLVPVEYGLNMGTGSYSKVHTGLIAYIYAYNEAGEDIIEYLDYDIDFNVPLLNTYDRSLVKVKDDMLIYDGTLEFECEEDDCPITTIIYFYDKDGNQFYDITFDSFIIQ